jgi:hypothetical protein
VIVFCSVPVPLDHILSMSKLGTLEDRLAPEGFISPFPPGWTRWNLGRFLGVTIQFLSALNCSRLYGRSM